MKTQEEKRQFILDTLLPYKLNPDLRAVEEFNGIDTCVYFSNQGKKCAFGKHMKIGEWQHIISSLFYLEARFKLSNILTEEALSYDLSIDEWVAIQRVHDLNFRNQTVDNLENITNLKFPELC